MKEQNTKNGKIRTNCKLFPGQKPFPGNSADNNSNNESRDHFYIQRVVFIIHCRFVKVVHCGQINFDQYARLEEQVPSSYNLS